MKAFFEVQVAHNNLEGTVHVIAGNVEDIVLPEKVSPHPNLESQNLKPETPTPET